MKKTVTLLLALIMIFVATGAFASNISVLVNGEEIVFDRGPEVQGDKVMIPFRFVAEKLGGVVAWDGETKTVFTSLGETISTMQIGNTNIFVNDAVISADIAPILPIDRTLVTEEVLESCLGAEVSWNKEANTVTITK